MMRPSSSAWSTTSARPFSRRRERFVRNCRPNDSIVRMENFAPGNGSKADSVTKPARILIIAGSDSGGGAGIQADIKTVTMLGGHAMTAVTAITPQNTLGGSAGHPLPPRMILPPIDPGVGGIRVDAVKIGMIGGAVAAEQVARRP